ncbi:MAG TPA: hypothetical protein VF173_27315 [Thermoanaerobaculia bacterium]|nr:hypothetical protein [Thermoanaerobaculia bacterium]
MAEKKFTVEVSFSGLCGFVPQKAASRSWVLLADESRPRIKKIQPHNAFLRFSLRDVVGSTGTNVPPGQGIWDIKGKDIKIITRNPDPKFEIASSFDLVASVEDAAQGRGFAGAGIVRPELIDEKMKKVEAGPLAARVLLNEGLLKVTRIASATDPTDNKAKFAVFRFRPFNGDPQKADHRQLVASEVVARMDIFDDYVELDGYNFGEDAVTEKLRLRPETGNLVKIFIFNEESSQVVDKANIKGLKLGKARHRDQIFASFFRLTSVPPMQDEIPIPVAEYLTDRADDGTAMAAPPCSPGRLVAS